MSSEARSVLRHSRSYAVASLLNRGVAFVLVPLYTHHLSAADYGLLGVITIVGEMAGNAIGLKLGVAMRRLYFDYQTPRERNEVVTSAILGLGALIVAIGIPVVLAAEPISKIVLGVTGQGNLFSLGITALLLNGLFTLGLSYLQARQRSLTFLLVSVARSLVYLGLGWLFVAALAMGVRGALLGVLATNALAAVGVGVPLVVRLRPRFSWVKLREMLAFGLPLLPGSLFENLVYFSDRFLLARLASLAAAGVYFLGFRLGSLLNATLVGPFAQIYVVRRLEAYGKGIPDPEAARVFTYFFLVVVTGCLGLALVAPEVIALAAPASYSGAATVVPLIALVQVALALLVIVELGLYYAKLSRHLTFATLVMVVIHVPLNALLIPFFGIVGSAAAGAVSMTSRVLVTARLARGHGGPRPEWRRLAAIAGAAVVTFAIGSAAGLALGRAGLVARMLLVAVFPFALLRSTLFDDRERDMIRSLIRWPAVSRAPGDAISG